ncbi:DUF4184 family protein [Streptomyces sp. RB6PN25]|uniref:DUF4184 family protein n=1 Tax=Streptomyces humicola TaxID=2953240 RepID=A0ABT1PY30_9ACTN|nr:DUF4184 family protein [Streptomyces humicola]MCQ4081457.1 DUF4184 family protein [Streptomyces humicola]
MPFTFSHPAAVLPALRTDAEGALRARGRLVAAGLIAGSIAPDIPFFAESIVPGVYGHGRIAHAAAGVAVLDPLLAAGLVTGWALVREPVVALLPPSAQSRAATLLAIGSTCDGHRPAATARSAGWFWVSAVAGAASHVGVDAFTHAGRWGTRHLPLLQRAVHGAPLYDWAQCATSAAGLAALAVHGTRAVCDTPHTAPPPRLPRLTRRARRTGAAVLASTALAGAALRHRQDRPRTAASLIASLTFGAGTGLALGAASVAAAVRAGERRNR